MDTSESVEKIVVPILGKFYVLVVTNAPPHYDWGDGASSITVASYDYSREEPENFIGMYRPMKWPVRLVLIPEAQIESQIGRYASGMYQAQEVDVDESPLGPEEILSILFRRMQKVGAEKKEE